MLIDLSRVLTHEGKKLNMTIEPSGGSYVCEMGSFPYVGENSVSLTIMHTENQVIRLEGEGTITVLIPCSRCLEPVLVSCPVDYDEEIDMKLSEEERIEALDESSFIQNKELDTDKLLHNEVLINWPMRVLCKEDCKGICSRCGANLNQGSCDCDTADLDPRMAVISDIFKNFKEV